MPQPKNITTEKFDKWFQEEFLSIFQCIFYLNSEKNSINSHFVKFYIVQKFLKWLHFTFCLDIMFHVLSVRSYAVQTVNML